MKVLMVLPESLWVKIESAAEEVDGDLEVLLVAVTSGFTFDVHDFAVEALGHAVGDAVLAVGQDVIQ